MIKLNNVEFKEGITIKAYEKDFCVVYKPKNEGVFNMIIDFLNLNISDYNKIDIM